MPPRIPNSRAQAAHHHYACAPAASLACSVAALGSASGPRAAREERPAPQPPRRQGMEGQPGAAAGASPALDNTSIRPQLGDDSWLLRFDDDLLPILNPVGREVATVLSGLRAHQGVQGPRELRWGWQGVPSGGSGQQQASAGLQRRELGADPDADPGAHPGPPLGELARQLWSMPRTP